MYRDGFLFSGRWKLVDGIWSMEFGRWNLVDRIWTSLMALTVMTALTATKTTTAITALTATTAIYDSRNMRFLYGADGRSDGFFL